MLWGMHGSRVFFFFSSRRRHTRYWRDWSSDVCSPDLPSTTYSSTLRSPALFPSYLSNQRIQGSTAMSTTKQNEANRANAQLSTGPRTAEGKAKSSLNAITHGLTATHLLIPTESADDFEAHAASLRAHFAPADPLRSLLVDQLIAAAWRLRRARLFERLILEQRADDVEDFQKAQGTTYHDPADYFALGYRGDCSGEKALDTLSRHETRIERAFYRALKALGDPPRISQNEPNSPLGRDPVAQTPRSAGPR